MAYSTFNMAFFLISHPRRPISVPAQQRTTVTVFVFIRPSSINGLSTHFAESLYCDNSMRYRAMLLRWLQTYFSILQVQERMIGDNNHIQEILFATQTFSFWWGPLNHQSAIKSKKKTIDFILLTKSFRPFDELVNFIRLNKVTGL